MKMPSNTASFYRFASLVLNVSIGLSTFILVCYLMLPLLFGGKVCVRALLVYGSWIGAALTIKFILSRANRKIQLKGYEFLLTCLYSIICMFLWFSPRLSIPFSIGVIISNIYAYNKQLKDPESRRRKG